jgi:hypothetical protein
VIFDLDRDCISKPVKYFCPRMAKGGVCWCVIGQNYFYVMMLLYREVVLSGVYTSVMFFKKTL